MKLKNNCLDLIFWIILICLKNYQFATSQSTVTLRQPATTSSQCQIPKGFERKFKLYPFNDIAEAGSFVDEVETIQIECNNGLKVSGFVNQFCRNGKWELPLCLNYCDRSRIEGLSTRAICNPRGNFGMCKENIPPNTEIQINCAPGYTNSLDRPQLIKCLPNGSFDKQREPCYQQCGRVESSEEGLSSGGVSIKPSRAPWHVAIYENITDENFVYICGGSIVSPRIIISAAHCFWDVSNQIKRNGKFKIIAGTTTKNYSITNNENAQLREVEQIHIPKKYNGRHTDHLNDFAIIILKTPLQYNEMLSSICIPDRFEKNSRGYVMSGLKGFITGFGVNNQLERLNMLTLSYHDCSARSPPDSPIASDKFCINTNDGTSVCRGDGGGGYVRETTKDTPVGSYTEYNLLGVISNTPYTINDCTREDSDAYVAVTSIYHVSDDLIPILNNARQEDTRLF